MEKCDAESVVYWNPTQRTRFASSNVSCTGRFEAIKLVMAAPKR